MISKRRKGYKLYKWTVRVRDKMPFTCRAQDIYRAYDNLAKKYPDQDIISISGIGNAYDHIYGFV